MVELHKWPLKKSGSVQGDTSLPQLLAVDLDEDEPSIYRELAVKHDLYFATFEQLMDELDPELTRHVSRAFEEHHGVIPIAKMGNTAVVASSNPQLLVPELGSALGCDEVFIWLVTPTDLRRLRMALDMDAIAAARQSRDSVSRTTPDLMAVVDDLDPELVHLFKAMLMDAVAERASDLHLEQHSDRVRVRLRIDGELIDVRHYRITPAQLAGLINVIKVQTGLDIAERRRPQGGRATVRVGDRIYDLRVQIQPSLFAEHAVIRLLPHSPSLLTIEDLGFPAEAAQLYRRLLRMPSGLVLVVGPTGSGKSTTLYSGLRLLAADASRKVITIEDPIEYAIEGLQQCEVKPEVGFRFDTAMRSFVRQDPDIILVGEIRDRETAMEAIRASQTGHLVLSTLHCNDTSDATQRLLDLGMHPNSIASELRAVFAQRLARRICDRCRRPVRPTEQIYLELFGSGEPNSEWKFFEGAGCHMCQGRGFHGRVAVIEAMRVTPLFRTAIARRATVDELRLVARTEGLLPMRDHALQLVHQGIIPLHELSRILDLEQIAAGSGAH